MFTPNPALNRTCANSRAGPDSSTLDVSTGIAAVARNPKEYGLSHEDRVHEIQRKFGASALQHTLDQLAQVINNNDRVLGAVIFLAREQHPEDIPSLIQLVNEDSERLLGAATVKDERG